MSLPAPVPLPSPHAARRVDPQPAPPEPGALERAAFCVTRARLARAAGVRKDLDALWPALLQLLPAAFLALVLVDNPRLPKSPLLAVPLVGAMALAVIHAGIIGPFALRALARALARLVPFLPWRALRRVVAWRAERLLARRGRIPREWTDRSWLRRRAVGRLLELEPELVRDADGVRPLGGRAHAGCARCGALMDSAGPGLRRCEYCGNERYEPLPAFAPRTEAGVGARPSFLDWLRVERPRLAPAARLSALGLASAGAAVAGCALLRFPQSAFFVVLLNAGVGAAVAAVCGLAWCADSLLSAWLQFRPGVREFDERMQREVLAVVEQQGQISLDALAQHLGTRRATLERVVASLGSRRALALYHDRQAERLVSTFARWHGDSRCRACGGHAVPAPGGFRCEHCGSTTPLSRPLARAPPSEAEVPEAPAALVEGPPSVSLEIGGALFRGGDLLRGRAFVAVSSPRRCEALLVQLWRTAPAGDGAEADTEIHRTLRLCERGELKGRRAFDFEFLLPDGPVSMSGGSFSLEWNITARARWPGEEPDTVAHRELELRPRVIPAPGSAAAPLPDAWPAAVRDAVRRALETSRREQRQERIHDLEWLALRGFVALGAACAAVAGVRYVVLEPFLQRARGAGFLGLGFLSLVALGATAALRKHKLLPGFSLLRRRPPVRVRRAPDFVLIGARTEVVCAFAPRQAAESVSWRVQCASSRRFSRTTRTRHGRRTTYRWETSWRTMADGVVPGSNIADPGAFALAFTVPPDVPPTLRLEKRRVRWRFFVGPVGARDGETAATDLEVLPFETREGEGEAGGR